MGFGSSPKAPAAPTPPPPVPTIDDASKSRDDSDALRKRKGRAASILAGKSSGPTKMVASAVKELMGG